METFRGRGCEQGRRSGNTGPENPFPIGLPEPSGRGWRSYLGPDCAATSDAQRGQPRTGGCPPDGTRQDRIFRAEDTWM